MVAAPLGAEEQFLLVEAKLALQRTVVNLEEEGGLLYRRVAVCVTWAKVGHAMCRARSRRRSRRRRCAVAVMRAPPDGYTLMVATSSTLATNVTLHKNLPYDPLTDFVPITLIALAPEVLLINASLPVRCIILAGGGPWWSVVRGPPLRGRV